MVPFHGRPFLAYLLDQLREQGFREVLLLVGYLAERIRSTSGTGADWGLRIRYVESPVEAETGRRIADAAPHMDPRFLLMYCDNYWPVRMPKLWEAYRAADFPQAMVTVYANRDGYTRSNVLVDEDGYVAVYDPTRATAGLNGVEIGYAILSREVLDYLPQENVSFEHTVLSCSGFPPADAGLPDRAPLLQRRLPRASAADRRLPRTATSRDPGPRRRAEREASQGRVRAIV